MVLFCYSEAMTISGESPQAPKTFFMGPHLEQLDCRELEAVFLDALPYGDTPEASLCADFSYLTAILHRARQLVAARRVSAMFPALLEEDLSAALDWTERTRSTPPSN
jgi:hypothetical protein